MRLRCVSDMLFLSFVGGGAGDPVSGLTEAGGGYLTLPAPSPLRQKRCRLRKAMMSGMIDRSAPMITTARISGIWLTCEFHA